MRYNALDFHRFWEIVIPNFYTNLDAYYLFTFISIFYINLFNIHFADKDNNSVSGFDI